MAAGPFWTASSRILLDVKNVTEDSPDEARWLQSRLKDNPILTLVSGDETNP